MLEDDETVEPSREELVSAWATLTQLYDKAIAGEITDRGFDTPTALRQARVTVAKMLSIHLTPEQLDRAVYDELDRRSASVHA